MVKDDALAVSFTTNGPIAEVSQPLFDVQQGDPSVAPELSFELRAQPVTATNPAGAWNVVLHTFKGGNEAKTDLGVPVTVAGNTLSYQVPLNQIPSVVSLQWQFGTSSVQADSSVPYDDCSSFTATTTTGWPSGRLADRRANGQCSPDLLGRARHVEVADAEVRQRVDHGVLHRRGGPDGARLADALGPQRVERGRRLHHHPLEQRELGRRDHRRSRRRWP